MDFQKIIAPTSKELFLSQMVKKILSGELSVGEKLPAERDLAEMMGINRSTAHSGLEELQRMGFVRMEPRRGNYIADYTHSGDFNTLTAVAQYGDGNFDTSMRINMVELRNALVGGAVIRLAKIGTSEDIKDLKQMMERHRKEYRDNSSVNLAAKQLIEFNMELVKLSGNTMFLLLMNSFAERNMPFWERCVEYWGMDSVLKQEAMIIDMLELGKGHDAALYLENMHEQYMIDNNLQR